MRPLRSPLSVLACVASLAAIALPSACTAPRGEGAAARQRSAIRSTSGRATATRFSDANGWGTGPQYYATIRAVDVNGDGLADVCGRGASGLACALSDGTAFANEVVSPALFADADGWGADAKYWSTLRFGDVDGDGSADVCGRSGAGIQCFRWTGAGFGARATTAILGDGQGGDAPQVYGTLALTDATGDGRADLCVRAAEGIRCYPSSGDGTFATSPVVGPAFSDADGWGADPRYYATIRWVDLDGDGRTDVCGRGSSGLVCAMSTGAGFGPVFAGPGFSDASGWGDPSYYSTLQFADVNGDGRQDVCARGAAGMVCATFDGAAFTGSVPGPGLSDAQGWGSPQYDSTIRLADVNGDRVADVCARGAAAAYCWLSSTTAFPTLGGEDDRFADSAGWNDPKYYASMQLADVNGDGVADLCGRSSTGFECSLSDAPSGRSPACHEKCDPLGRTCDIGLADVTICGGCKVGLVADEGGRCAPAAPCVGLDCRPAACAVGSVWDGDRGSCRPTRRCADLPCAGGQACAEATDHGDAQCTGSVCAAGKGQWVEGGADGGAGAASASCRACAFAPACNDPGETGNVVAFGADEPATCACDVRDGYFNSLETGGAVPCDADGDGWVNEDAEAVLSHPDPAVRGTARCHVRRVTKVVLENEDHQKTEVDLTASFPDGLPLYESARNDSADAPPPFGTVGAGKVVNSLTKACVDATADYNHNGIADVAEGQDSALGAGFQSDHAARKQLAVYYQAYTSLSYFLELHNGWYDAPPGGKGPGTYHIQERLRMATAAAGVAMRDWVDPGRYFRECPRQADASYAAPGAVRIGGDFVTQGGMTHHSQFKCVEVVTPSDYAKAGANAATQPHLFFLDGARSLARLPSNDPAAQPERVPWSLNACAPTTDVLTAPGTNPSFVGMACSPQAPSDRAPVGWAVVTQQGSRDAGGAYLRGCVDLCNVAPKACDSGTTCRTVQGLPACIDVDECAARTASCQSGDGGKICRNEVGTYSCQDCGPYASSDGYACTDIDECAKRTAQCSAGTTCRNVPNGYACDPCPAGMTSDGFTCTDVNECKTGAARCDAHATCVDDGQTGSPGYSCKCQWPYEGAGWPGQCALHDFCATNNGGCSRFASCTSSRSGAVCTCVAGYHGNGVTCVKDPPPTCGQKCADDPDPALCLCLCRPPPRRQC